MDIRDVAVIGAGPAGIAAAIQLKRSGIDPLLLEGSGIGGLLWNANLVENYPGFPEGIRGPDLAGLFIRQLERAGVEAVFEKVLKLEYSDEAFTLITDGGEKGARIVIVATGTEPRRLQGVRISGTAAGRIVYGPRAIPASQDKTIAIIGGGDAAFDYALNMSVRNDVLILNRGGRARCIPLLRERCGRSPKVTYFPNVTVREIGSGEGKVVLRCSRGDGCRRDFFEADYVMIAVGREPAIDFLGNGVKDQLDSLVKAGALHMIGDVVNGRYRQAAIAVGDGIMAAMRVQMELG